MQTSTLKSFRQQGGRKEEGQTEKNGWKIRVSKTANTNHNQMGKSSNSGKSLVKEKEKFHRGKRKEGGRWRGGILSSSKAAFSLWD